LFEFRRINDIFDISDIFPESRKKSLSSELNILFAKFLISIEHVLNENLLRKLQKAFSEWIWAGPGFGFSCEVTIKNAIRRIQKLQSQRDIPFDETEIYTRKRGL
jgi:hypothetical protein